MIKGFAGLFETRGHANLSVRQRRFHGGAWLGWSDFMRNYGNVDRQNHLRIHANDLRSHANDLRSHANDLRIHANDLRSHANDLRSHANDLRSHANDYSDNQLSKSNYFKQYDNIIIY